MPDRAPTTEPSSPQIPGALSRFEEDEINQLLRGFSDSTIEAALALQSGSRIVDFEACLYGILIFFRPAGAQSAEGLPSGDTRLREDLGLDSLSMMEAMFKIEELFDISISNAELATIETIADARRLLEEKLRLKTSA